MSPHLSQPEKFQDSTFHWKMHAHSFLELHRHHSPEVDGQRYYNELQVLRKAPRINRVHRRKKLMLLQHDNTRPHTTAATSVAAESIGFELINGTYNVKLDLKFFHTLPTAKIWHRLTSGCLQLKRNISLQFVSHVTKFRLL
jgi:hypothetical protein